MQQRFDIRKANPLDAKSLAIIHRQHISTGFLSQLGVQFLELLYTAMIQSQKIVCLVAEGKNGRVVGFVSGCFHVKGFYKEFLVKHSLRAALILASQIVKPSILKKVFETLRYPSKNGVGEVPEAELLAIAVNPDVRGKGVSYKLVERLFRECQARDVQEIKVIVAARNTRANYFYKNVGFKMHSGTSVHESEVSNLYVKTLN